MSSRPTAIAALLLLSGAGCPLAPLRTIDLLRIEDAGESADTQVGEPEPLTCSAFLAAAAAREADAGRSNGDGATDDDGGAAGPELPMCGPSFGDGYTCPPTLPLGSSCVQYCGPGKIGRESCYCDACPGGSGRCLKCGICNFPLANDYACYLLPGEQASCPFDPRTDGGFPYPNSECSFTTCAPCATDYFDSHGVRKNGYCVCDRANKWSCASSKEWPPACLTSR